MEAGSRNHFLANKQAKIQVTPAIYSPVTCQRKSQEPCKSPIKPRQPSFNQFQKSTRSLSIKNYSDAAFCKQVLCRNEDSQQHKPAISSSLEQLSFMPIGTPIGSNQSAAKIFKTVDRTTRNLRKENQYQGSIKLFYGSNQQSSYKSHPTWSTGKTKPFIDLKDLFSWKMIISD